MKPASDEIRNFYIAPRLTAPHCRGEPNQYCTSKLKCLPAFGRRDLRKAVAEQQALERVHRRGLAVDKKHLLQPLPIERVDPGEQFLLIGMGAVAVDLLDTARTSYFRQKCDTGSPSCSLRPSVFSAWKLTSSTVLRASSMLFLR